MLPETLLTVAALLIPGALTGRPVKAEATTLSDTLRVEVELSEYSFAPDPIRIPAGRPVELLLRNVGETAHEFMVGRQPGDNGFAVDLFHDLDVTVHPGSAAGGMEMEHAEAMEEREGRAGAGPDDAAAEEREGEEEVEADHGTMVVLRPGETATLTFTLPEDRVGAWTTACFLPGHPQLGMTGFLRVGSPEGDPDHR